jgi:hypothetical protein
LTCSGFVVKLIHGSGKVADYFHYGNLGAMEWQRKWIEDEI